MLPLETKSKLLWTFIVLAPTCIVTYASRDLEVNLSGWYAHYITANSWRRKFVHNHIITLYLCWGKKVYLTWLTHKNGGFQNSRRTFYFNKERPDNKKKSITSKWWIDSNSKITFGISMGNGIVLRARTL